MQPVGAFWSAAIAVLAAARVLRDCQGWCCTMHASKPCQFATGIRHVCLYLLLGSQQLNKDQGAKNTKATARSLPRLCGIASPVLPLFVLKYSLFLSCRGGRQVRTMHWRTPFFQGCCLQGGCVPAVHTILKAAAYGQCTYTAVSWGNSTLCFSCVGLSGVCCWLLSEALGELSWAAGYDTAHMLRYLTCVGRWARVSQACSS